ncbi:MAG: type VI secretion system membrane subunit TssM, partial [Planctomycetota bacterium]
MGAILKSIIAGGLVTLVVLAVVTALIWLGGEYLELPTETRILLMVGVLAVWLVIFLVQRLIAARRAKHIEDQLRAQAQEQITATSADSKEQVEALQKQFREALQALKVSRLGKSALYTMPWYVLLGPPGAGKSTALLQSGLNFPSLGQGPRGVRGIGGTRNCDWWFTEEGIFLDTAGRYTTEVDDHPEWFAFLDLLRNTRRSRPVNGAIVAVSISDLLQIDENAIDDFAQPIRERLDELCRRLDIVFPTYVVFTKFDWVKGFSDFFDTIDRPGRSQVWGATFPLSQESEISVTAGFEKEVQTLYDGLGHFRINALTAGGDPEKAEDVYLFPLRFAFVQDRIRAFLEALFRPNPFQESAALRGFYYTSAIQTNDALDPLIPIEMGGKEEAEFESPAVPSPSDPENKSFFLTQLFTDVILPDRNLVRLSTKRSKQRTLLQATSRVLSVSLLALIGISMVVSFFGNRFLVGDVTLA